MVSQSRLTRIRVILAIGKEYLLEGVVFDHREGLSSLYKLVTCCLPRAKSSSSFWFATPRIEFYIVATANSFRISIGSSKVGIGSNSISP